MPNHFNMVGSIDEIISKRGVKMKAIKFYYENHNTGESGHRIIIVPELTDNELMHMDYNDVLAGELRFLAGSNNFRFEIEWIKNCEIKE